MGLAKLRSLPALLYAGILMFVGATGLLAQNSPFPNIFDYSGKSLPDTLAPDSAFCKGSNLLIHGAYFTRAQGGETWDSTQIFFGGLNGIPGRILQLNSSGNGQNDTMEVEIPDIFQEDTCMAISVVKSTLAGSIPFTYSVTDTICLIGDYAQITYPDTLFCIGEPNPLPQIALSSTTTGAFCCAAGPSGFIVLANGEVPLYNGSAGIDNTFEYRTTHPICGDTLQFKMDILPTATSVALYNNQPTLTICQTSASYPVADSASVVPAVGSGHFADPTGNVLVLDSLTGLIDPAGCSPGTHDLLYIPHLPCYDTAIVQVTVNAPATAQVIYPTINGQPPRLCVSDPVANPAYLSGSPGGQYWSDPAGVAFGPSGEILPWQCAPGTFNIYYLPAGSCADTVQVLSGLLIDSASTSNLGYTSLSLCVSDTLSFGTLPPGWCGVFQGGNALYTGPNAVLPLSGPFGLGMTGGEVLTVGYSQALVCSDTAWATVTVQLPQSAAFSYPQQGYCLGDPDPQPVISGNGGGRFNALTPNTVVDSLTGRIDLDSSGTGQHLVNYTTPGPCADSMVVLVDIYAGPVAAFSYPISQYCPGDSNPTPVITGTPGGNFSAGAGLVIDPDSGTIDLAASQPGTYTIVYALSGSCGNVFAQQTVQILPFDTSSVIEFLVSDYCRDGVDPRPAIFGDSLGTFIGSLGLVFSNRDQGRVDLDLSGPGSYVVTLDLDNRCALDPTDTINVSETDDPFFRYPLDNVCAGGGTLATDSAAMPGGVFSCNSPDLVFADSFGSIDLQRSQPGGPYSITQSTTGPCPATSTRTLTIFPRPTGGSLESYPGGTVCSGEQATFRAVATPNGAGSATAFHWFLNGDSAAGIFDLFQSDSLQDGDSLVCVLENAFGCTDTLSVQVNVAPVPQVAILERPFRLVRGQKFRVELGSNVASTIYDWHLANLQNVIALQDSGRTVDLNPGENVPVVVQLDLEEKAHPGFASLVIQPQAGDCIGPSDTIRVEILPSDFPIFVPEIITPNGDGLNDTWLITWQEAIDPNDYELHLYNRAGGQVALLRPIHANWQPGTLPDGIYWWTLQDRSGETVQAGGLKIMRK